MSASASAELDRLFKASERKRSCLVASDARLRNLLRRRVDAGELLRRRVDAGEVVSPAKTLYARSSYWVRLRRHEQAVHVIRALQEKHPDWTFCRESAALAWGLPVSYAALDVAHVATRHYGRSSRDGLIRFHAEGDFEPKTVQGIRVTSLELTVMDCLRAASFTDGLAIADRALAVGKTSARKLSGAIRALGVNHRGARRAIGILAYADARSESWAESAVRALAISQGFALPRLQVEYPDPQDRSSVFRVDMVFATSKGDDVLCEVDGFEKYEDELMLAGRSPVRALADEQHREARLTLYGKPIMRFSYYDIVDTTRFVERMLAYDIARRPEVARQVRELAKTSPGSALSFTVMPIDPDLVKRVAEE